MEFVFVGLCVLFYLLLKRYSASPPLYRHFQSHGITVRTLLIKPHKDYAIVHIIADVETGTVTRRIFGEIKVHNQSLSSIVDAVMLYCRCH